MSNTYTQLYIQLVFAVKFREALITESIRDGLQKFLTGIAQNNKHKMLAVYCMPDHTHVLVGLHPTQSISGLAADLKSNSSRWLNETKQIRHQFNWQEGYGAFSYHKSRLPGMINYVLTQNEHHKKKSFRDEYLGLLNEFDIGYDEKYLFTWLE